MTLFYPQCPYRYTDKTFVTKFDMKNNYLYKPFHVSFTKSGLSRRGGTRYFYPPKMVFGTS